MWFGEGVLGWGWGDVKGQGQVPLGARLWGGFELCPGSSCKRGVLVCCGIGDVTLVGWLCALSRVILHPWGCVL